MSVKLSDLLRHANHPGYAMDAEALEEGLDRYRLLGTLEQLSSATDAVGEARTLRAHIEEAMNLMRDSGADQREYVVYAVLAATK
jgi:hypothetical protein